MDKQFKNPHTFDMNEYFSGMKFDVGGVDFLENEDKKKSSKDEDKKIKRIIPDLDWSFLTTINTH